MSLPSLISRLRELDVKIWVEGDRLKINAPKGTITPELQAEISGCKEEMIEYLRAAERASASKLPAITRRPQADQIPLSFAQQSMWFLQQINPDQVAYNLWKTLAANELLDKDVLERSLSEIALRHETLRTSFHVIEGQPYQMIEPPRPLKVEEIDLSHLAGHGQHSALRELIIEKSCQPIDLSCAPLLRAYLVVLSPSQSIFLIIMHHIISDGTSMQLLFNEITELYTAMVAERSPRLPNLPVQYSDYIHWQNDLQQGNKLEPEIAYWKNKLGGSLDRIEIPTDFPWPFKQDLSAGQKIGFIPEMIHRRLLQKAQDEGVTLFVILLAAFKVLLSRISGQSDIIVGTPIWGRNRPELEDMIGLFLNTLVLRTEVSSDLTFDETVQRVKETVLEAFEHQDLPFEQLVEEINPERRLNRNPIFDILINFLPPADPNTSLSGGGFQVMEIPEPEAKFPLTLYISQANERLNLQMVYQTAVFTEQRIDFLMDQYLYLLEQICERSDRKNGSYSLISPKIQSLLPNPNLILEQPDQTPIPELIHGWAVKAPAQPAIQQNGITWSFSDLTQASTAIAHSLLEMGCAKGDVVAVRGPRCFGLISAMVGVLASGGVLLTLDPNLPVHRHKVMLEESHARWLVEVGAELNATQTTEESLNIQVLKVDPKSGQVIPPSSHSLTALPVLSGDDPAYIFFTSGTTSKPKGVLGKHGGLAHFIQWQIRTFDIHPGDRAAQLTHLSFDVVLRDILTPLAGGACLYIPSPETAAQPDRLLAWMKQEQITLFHTVPAIAQNWLVDAPETAQIDSLRWVFFAGEPLTDALVKRWRERISVHGGIVNLYGPTETTLAKFYYRVPGEPFPGIQPVGSPLPQTQALILNPSGIMCSVGERGEIYIRTPFRSAGYINNPDEQQKRFVRNMLWTGEVGQDDIVYRSGDMGRYRPDGLIEILGREDEQVKINGVRVELGEVTSALLEHPAVGSGVIIARKEPGVQPYLAAYVIVKSGQTLSQSDLRQHLAERLPVAMIPARYIFLDHFPLNANGKVDRKMLPDPGTVMEKDSVRSQPRDVVEARLIQIWKNLLHLKQVGVSDDFFMLGGHSMMAVRMFMQIQEVFGVNLPITTLFREATIEHLAREINRQGDTRAWSSLVEIKTSGERLPLFCVHGMTGDVYWFGRMVPFIHPDQPMYGLQSRGLDGVNQPIDNLQEMAAHYIREMQTIQPEGPYYITGYSFGGSVAYEMACQLQQAGHQVGLLAIIDHATPKSGYYQVKLTPRFFVAFISNLPYRMRDVLLLRPDQFLARFLRKLRVFRKFSMPGISAKKKGEMQVSANEIIDDAANLTLAVQKVIEANFKAIRDYVPGYYNDTLTLLRARGGRLMVSQDPHLGWDKFVKQVNVRMISGSHIHIFHPTHVKHLVDQLNNCLVETQQEDS